MTRTISILLVALAVGCGTTEAAPTCGEADVQACLVDQRGCALDASGAAECVPCGIGTRADARGACAAIPGAQLVHDFPENVSMPGQELLGDCRSWTLGNETELWVRAVEIEQDEGSHHSNWTFVPETAFDGPDGVWPCDERGYDEISAALMGGVIYAQSTQATHEVQLFPEGAAVRIPPHARIISDIHVLNLTTAEIRGHMRFALYTAPREEVTIALAPIHFSYRGLAIPPRTTSRFQTTCEVAQNFQATFDRPHAIRMFYALPHTHALGTRVFLEAVGGARDGESIFDVHGYNGEARGRSYQPPLDLTGVESIRFGCEFTNPRAESIGWGFGDQEMCDFLGFIESPGALTSSIPESAQTGTDGDVPVYEGACSTYIIPWEDRLGG